VTLAVGIDVGATKVAAGVVEVDTGRIQSSSVAASNLGRGGAALLRDCVEGARQVAGDFAIDAVGVAVCETVALDGRVTSAYSFDWRELEVARAFSEIAPARIESDVRAAASAEARFGAGREHASFLYVNAGAAELARAAEAGERSATHVLRDAGAALGQAIAFAVNLLDPEVVVIGGGLALGSAIYTSAAEIAMRGQVWSENTKEIPLVQGALGLEAGMIGAALSATAPRAVAS
jgi:predicted NBD/HSP70 family sugar kinase